VTPTIASILDDTIAALRRAPHVVLESAVVLPGRTRESMKELEHQSGVALPPWLAELYTQVGGAHLSWRLSAAGYEQLQPVRSDNDHRYDISGNLDLLAPEELSYGFTGHPWARIYGDRAKDYRPLDFASYHLNVGFVSPPGDGDDLVLLDLYEDRLARLGVTLIDYLQAGGAQWFLDEWQLSLLGDARYASRVNELRDIAQQLARGPVRSP
jgi:hypothetical protein